LSKFMIDLMLLVLLGWLFWCLIDDTPPPPGF